MTQTRIPTEIILHITNYLTPDEKRKGLLICKDWHEVFLYGLYHHVSIHNMEQFKLLLRGLVFSHYYDTSISNGQLIRTLSISKQTSLYARDKLIIPRLFFDQLPDLCPNLEVLDFDPETWKFIHYHHNISKWKNCIQQLPTLSTMASLPFVQCLGKSIRKLSIQSDMLVDVSTPQKLTCILSFAPDITHFSIIGNKATTTLSLGLEDIELIHQLLPNLTYFSIKGEHIQMLESTLTTSSLVNIPTAPQIKSLHWETLNTPVTWIHYVTHKYPLVQNLTLAIRNLPEEDPSPLCIRLIEYCDELKILSLSCAQLSDWLNPSFLNVLAQSNHVQQVSPILNKDNHIKIDAELGLALKIRHLITALEIEQWRLDTKLPCTLQILKKFTRLTHLELKCDTYNTDYDMDVLLDSCPRLESLILIWGTLVIQPVTKCQYHPLRSLSITFVAFLPRTFTALSNRCRSLSTLVIARCKQLCEMKDLATQTVIELDMPYNQFELVVLDGIRLDHSMACMFYHNNGPNYIRIASIMKTSNTKWYYHSGYSVLKVPWIHQLDDENAQVVQNYFFRRNQRRYFHSNQGFLENLSKQKVDHGLKMSMMFGVVRIKCKSCQHFSLEGNFSSQQHRQRA